ncbi:Dabb family protein [Rhizobium bangladeshense]|uniref:Dabb family protein n=1 Tax=Rhizobium bangladeshense TaxID=1138189 RepID=UPI0009ED5B28|nr:Dabb family protein [Rhizobium bangladeshense]
MLSSPTVPPSRYPHPTFSRGFRILIAGGTSHSAKIAHLDERQHDSAFAAFIVRTAATISRRSAFTLETWRQTMKIRMIASASLILTLFAAPALADVHHFVALRYERNVDASIKAEIAERFKALKNTSMRNGKPYIMSITGGDGISKEGFDQGFEQGFLVIFASREDRDYFVGKPYSEVMDPSHQAVAQFAEPHFERDANGKVTGIFVYDYIVDGEATSK